MLAISLISMPVFAGFISLAVDLGRVRVAQAELQAAADSAARAAARELSNNTGLAQNVAASVLASNKADGDSVESNISNVEFGQWNPNSRSFVPSSAAVANSVRVTARIGRPGRSVPTLWAGLLGFSSVQPKASAVAMANSSSFQASSNVYVPARSNPFAAGLPANATITDMWGSENLAGGINWGGWGPYTYTSLAATGAGMPVAAGDQLQVSASGAASWQEWGQHSYAPLYGPDGDTSWTNTNINPWNFPGMSNIRVPGNALVAVFLTDNAPSGTAPSTLDFSTAAARDYSTLSPQIAQVFFVGDGKDANGQPQTIVAPPGATRMFYGFMDAHCWRDNLGGFNVTTSKTSSGVSLVR
jgi:Flp pilus assembly protein TadG